MERLLYQNVRETDATTKNVAAIVFTQIVFSRIVEFKNVYWENIFNN